MFLECPGRPLGLPGRGGSISSGERPFPDSARLLVATDGVLELGPEAQQRQKREEVRLAFEQSEGIDALVRRLGLADGASLRDDVAILYVGGSARGDRKPLRREHQERKGAMADGRVTYAQQQGWHVLHYMGKVDYTLAPAIDRFVDGLFGDGSVRPFVFDLSEARMLDSTNLGLIARAADRVQAAGGPAQRHRLYLVRHRGRAGQHGIPGHLRHRRRAPRQRAGRGPRGAGHRRVVVAGRAVAHHAGGPPHAGVPEREGSRAVQGRRVDAGSRNS